MSLTLKLIFFLHLIVFGLSDQISYLSNEFVEVRPEHWRWFIYGASPDEYIPDRNPSGLKNEPWYTKLFPPGYLVGNGNNLMIEKPDIAFVNGLSEASTYRFEQSQTTAVLKLGPEVPLAPTELQVIVRWGNICRNKGMSKVFPLMMSKLGSFKYNSESEDIVTWDYRILECQCTAEPLEMAIQIHLTECKTYAPSGSPQQLSIPSVPIDGQHEKTTSSLTSEDDRSELSPIDDIQPSPNLLTSRVKSLQPLSSFIRPSLQ